MDTMIADLNTKGYAVVPNCISADEIAVAMGHFRAWVDANAALIGLHHKIDPHGIFKYGEIGHQVHAWYVKTLDSVQSRFKAIWNTDELTTGFDGTCWIKSEFQGRDKCWTHTDQAPNKIGRCCVQGFIALTTNSERTLVVYEGSHLLHAEYMRSKGLTGSKNWHLIDEAYLASICHLKRVLHVDAGSLVLWDSRTFHQNQYGRPGEERVVQYVCFLPKNVKANSKVQRQKRAAYFKARRTTSHWPYPLNVNGLQPRTYGNPALMVDYPRLVAPDLDALMPKILPLL